MRVLTRRPSLPEGVSPPPPTSSERLEEFYGELYLPLVWRAAWKRGLSKEDARDVVQEAFVLAVTKLKGEADPRGWLNQVVDYLCANHQRKTLRRARLAARWGERGLIEGESSSDQGSEVEVDH